MVAPTTSSLWRFMSSSTATNQKFRFFSEFPLCASHMSSRLENLLESAETTGQAQIQKALGAPSVLRCLSCDVDEEAINAEPDSKLVADGMGMANEDNAKEASAISDGGMIVGDDGAAIPSAPCHLVPCPIRPTDSPS